MTIKLILCTTPDEKTAQLIASTLVKEKLAACVNIVPGVQSVYMWGGQLQKDDEMVLVIKSRRALLAAIADALKAVHPYDVPELIALPIVAGSLDYLSFVRGGTLGAAAGGAAAPR